MLPSTGRVKLNRNVLKIDGSNLPRRRRSLHLLSADPNSISNAPDCTLLPSKVTIHGDSGLVDPDSHFVKSGNNVILNSGREHGHPHSPRTVVEKTPCGSAESGEEHTPADPVGACEGMAPAKRNGLKCMGPLGTVSDFEVKLDPYTTGQYVQATGEYVQATGEGPLTRSKSATISSGAVVGHNALCCRLQVALCFCCGVSNNTRAEKPETRNPGSSMGLKSRHVSYYIKSGLSGKPRGRPIRSGAAGLQTVLPANKTNRESVHGITGSTERSEKIYCSNQTVKKTHQARAEKTRNRNPVRATLKPLKEQGRKIKLEVKKVQAVVSVESAGIQPRSTYTQDAGQDADAGQDITRIFSLPNGTSNIYRSPIVESSHPKPCGAQQSVGRVVRTSCCALCGEVKYTPPKRKIRPRAEPVGVSGRSGADAHTRVAGSEKPKVRVKTRRTNTCTVKAQKNAVIWIEKYPQVKLCDVAQVCDVMVGDSSCLLPTELITNKVVRCFKQDYRREGTLLGPSCSGGDHGSEITGELPVRKTSHYHSQCGQRYGLLQDLSNHQYTPTQEHRLTGVSTDHSASPVAVGDGTFESFNVRFASLSLGQRRMKSGASEAETRDVGSLEHSRTGSDVAEAEGTSDVTAGKPVAKRMRSAFVHGDVTEQKQQSNVNGQALDSGLATSSVRANGEDPELPCDVKPVHALVGIISDISVAQNCSQRPEVEWDDGSPEFPAVEALYTCLEDGLEEDPGMFSCRRVETYTRRLPLSCARTYLTWPFPQPDPTRFPSETSPVDDASRTLTAPVESGPSAGCCGAEALMHGGGPPLVSAEGAGVSAPRGALSELSTQASQQALAHTGLEAAREEGGGDKKVGEEKDSGNAAEEKSLDGNNACVSPPPKTSISPILTPPEDQTDTGVDYFFFSSLSQDSTKPFVSSLSPPVSAFSPPTDGSDAPRSSTASPVPASTPLSLALRRDTVTLCPPRPVCISQNKQRTTNQFAETSLLPGLSRNSAESSVLSPSSFFLLPHEESVTFQEQSLDGDDQKGETARRRDQRDDLEVSTSTRSSSPENQDQPSRDEKNKRRSVPLSRSRESGDKATSTVAPEILRGRIPRLRITRLRLPTRRCSDDNADDGQENEMLRKNREDQKENLPGTAVVVTQARPSTIDEEDDGRGDAESDECGQLQSSVVVNQESVVKTQSKLFNNQIKATSCTKVRTENQEAGVVTSSRSPSQHQEVEVSEGSKFQAAIDTKADLLDEFTAYKQDILVLDVLLDDPELFSSVPQDSVQGLGPTWRKRAPGARTNISAARDDATRVSWASEKSSTTCTEGTAGSKANQRRINQFKGEQSAGSSWSPAARSSPIHSPVHNSSSWPPADQALCLGQRDTDWNNNRFSPGQPGVSERAPAILTVRSSNGILPPLMTGKSWCHGRNAPSTAAETGPQRHFDTYCKYYFSLSGCFHKNCWFLHVPKKGDEKFCVDAVLRLVRASDPVCLLRAVSVFTSYYRSSPPDVFYTPLLLTSLLSALLRAGYLSDIINVLQISTAHNLLPSSELLLALFDYVREKDQSVLPVLIQLTSKSPLTHPTKSASNSTTQPGNLRSFVSPGAQSLTRALMDLELCAQNEDWGGLGVVFHVVCRSHRSLAELQHFSGQVAIALLTDSKDKLALPFGTFSETVHQETENWDNSLVKSFLGRIGVSLMCRYHKTQQWTKGQRLVEVLSRLKVNYSFLKGLFGNEDGATRCRLITIATELLLRSNSVEGALNTLRDNGWFLSSGVWPCSVEDLTERRDVLVQLAEKTSHRDTLEILTNLPGLKEPAELADASVHENLFNRHLKSCVDRQSVTVAADTLNFMLSKDIAVHLPLLHDLLHKLGKQNVWLRARALFKQALSLGYYPGVKALPGSLTVPCSLGVMEMALAFEMVITLNAATILNTEDKPQTITVTLKRSGEKESEYLAAGSCLLSAAIVPNPKLTVHYTAVSSCQEQLFTVDGQTARRWLRHNHTWANDVWTGIDQHSPSVEENKCSL
ncbi:hypothetical protein DPEC_G00286430 [Dallia pectoralis]|uniref:Uncharacterized protein n=1 Tax=Dallia pectoralis TaxID=75939 RepID=A0ACC2FK72_DALPE|nr:hypothetical protein DPEC_G00286430 [Dallia pectoralis]